MSHFGSCLVCLIKHLSVILMGRDRVFVDVEAVSLVRMECSMERDFFLNRRQITLLVGLGQGLSK